MTEDVYFCLKAQRVLGRKNLSVYVHTGVPTAHLMDPQIIYPSAIEVMKKRAEEDEPLLLKAKEREKDRGDEYAKEVEDMFAGIEGIPC